MNLTDVLNDPPRPHKDARGEFQPMGLTRSSLEFIYDNVDESCATLETGCGLSTVIFALTGSRHIAISPVADEFEALRIYCDDRKIPIEQISFIVNGSEKVLPNLDMPPLDLVLIDGRHGFPAPYIDWFYTAGKLKKGGYVIVDDVWVWSCQILREFLDAQPEWEHVVDYDRRTSIFRKLEDGAELQEWTGQPLVALSGRMKWIDGEARCDEPVVAPEVLPAPTPAHTTAIGRAFNDLGKGDFKSLARKIGRRLKT
jgi:hypothetical protein